MMSDLKIQFCFPFLMNNKILTSSSVESYLLCAYEQNHSNGVLVQFTQYSFFF